MKIMQVPDKGGVAHLACAQAVEVHHTFFAVCIAHPVLGEYRRGAAQEQQWQYFFHGDAGSEKESGRCIV